MRTGVVEANLVRLDELFLLPYLGDLIARKLEGTERQSIEDSDGTFLESEYHRLREMLTMEAERTSLPEETSAREALHALLLRLRGLQT
jgi:predicted nucleotidyltransferase